MGRQLNGISRVDKMIIMYNQYIYKSIMLILLSRDSVNHCSQYTRSYNCSLVSVNRYKSIQKI